MAEQPAARRFVTPVEQRLPRSEYRRQKRELHVGQQIAPSVPLAATLDAATAQQANTRFDQDRVHVLRALEQVAPDRSRAGHVDVAIVPFVNLVNTKRDIYTTSSCAGRTIVTQQLVVAPGGNEEPLLPDGSQPLQAEPADSAASAAVATPLPLPSPSATTAVAADAAPDVSAAAEPASLSTGYGIDWLVVSHDHVTTEHIMAALDRVAAVKGAEVWFKFESPLVALCCRSLDVAAKLLKVARAAGIKRSFVSSLEPRLICTLFDTKRVELPLCKDGVRLVTAEYVALAVQMANERMDASRRRFEQLRQAIDAHFANFDDPTASAVDSACVSAAASPSTSSSPPLALTSAPTSNSSSPSAAVAVALTEAAVSATTGSATPEADSLLGAALRELRASKLEVVLEVFSREQIMQREGHLDECLISISTPPAPPPTLQGEWGHVLALAFYDSLSGGGAPGLFSAQMARSAIDFLVARFAAGCRHVCFHCDAGVSRSVAFAVFTQDLLGGKCTLLTHNIGDTSFRNASVLRCLEKEHARLTRPPK